MILMGHYKIRRIPVVTWFESSTTNIENYLTASSVLAQVTRVLKDKGLELKNTLVDLGIDRCEVKTVQETTLLRDAFDTISTNVGCSFEIQNVQIFFFSSVLVLSCFLFIYFIVCVCVCVCQTQGVSAVPIVDVNGAVVDNLSASDSHYLVKYPIIFELATRGDYGVADFFVSLKERWYN
jgi:hypothetical protein